MKNIHLPGSILMFLIMISSLSSGVCLAQVPVREELKGLEEYIIRGMADWKIPGLAVSVVKDGEIIFEKGEGVSVISGAFRGYTGTVDEVNQEKGKLKVLINIFGRDTPVEVNFEHAQKLV